MIEETVSRVRERVIVSKVDVSGDEARVVEEIDVVLIDGRVVSEGRTKE